MLSSVSGTHSASVVLCCAQQSIERLLVCDESIATFKFHGDVMSLDVCMCRL